MRRLESAVERDLVLRLYQLGADLQIDLEIIKLAAMGRRGYPDRLLLWAGGNMVFIELKRPGERPRKLQEYIHGALRRMGFKVKVYDDTDVAMADLEKEIRASTGSDARAGTAGKGERS